MAQHKSSLEAPCLSGPALSALEAFQRGSEPVESVLRTIVNELVNASERAQADKPSISTLVHHFRPLLPELLERTSILLSTPDSRNSDSQNGETVKLVATLARVVSIATEHWKQAHSILHKRNLPTTASFYNLTTLLSLLRLIRISDRFAQFANASTLTTVYSSHPDPATRYVAIRLFSVVVGVADASFEQMVERYVWNPLFKDVSPHQRHLNGLWDGVEIDYQFVDLWEERRRIDFVEWQAKSTEVNKAISPFISAVSASKSLSPGVISLGDVLVTTSGRPSDSHPHFVNTPTSIENLQSFAHAYLQPEPLLLTGVPGAGKTYLLNYAASLLNKRESLVTLHLNEQTDARVLVGMYSSGTAGSFDWIPGILTTAVLEGRWVVIEDFDRAPEAVVSLLLPLLERNELSIPSRGETIKAANGFRIFGTVRADPTGRFSRESAIIGLGLWKRVNIKALLVPELRILIGERFPALLPHISTVETLFTTLTELYSMKKMQQQSTTIRPFGTGDLLKWCSRVNRLLKSSASFTDDTLDSMLLHGVECFADSLAAGQSRDMVITAIARGLQLAPQRKDFLVSDRTLTVHQPHAAGGISVGRASILPLSSLTRLRSKPIDLCQHTLRYLEKLCLAVNAVEPVLLVGETGIGKTATIQMLARSASVGLQVYNMSQQSEVGDLLGSFKPVTVGSLISPLQDEFAELFRATFGGKNERFADMLRKAVDKKQWKRVVKLWRSAIDTYMASITDKKEVEAEERPSKKRKPNGASAEIKARWTGFAESLKAVEPRVSDPSSKPVFTYVEGNFIKAVRTGGWVLLDEINLASLDTLEPILDLLGTEEDSGPTSRRFITLAESGSVTQVEAHPNFRIFAAMNPATDVGKRDLPMSIRTRFTEIYFPSPDGDRASLESIVGSYLHGTGDLDRQLAVDATDVYLQIQRLATGNRLVDGAGERPHFSLRTLIRALVYANDALSVKGGVYRRALGEGFEMSFSTALDGESRSLVEPVIWKGLKVKPPAPDSVESLAASETDGTEIPGRIKVGSGYLPAGKGEVTQPSNYIVTASVAKNISNMVRVVSTQRYPVLLQGPTSAGKTSMIEYLAQRSGNVCVRINNHEHTDLQEYLGSYVSQGEQLVFKDGALVRAMRAGHWLILDELNLAPSEILEALNRLLDDNRELFIPETQETVRPHPDFVLFATQNPAGLYGGRKHLSRAFRNRFVELHFADIPVDELSYIIHQRSLIPESWSRKMVDVYKTLAVQRQSNRLFEARSFVTLRDLFRWAGRAAETMDELAVNGYMLLGERVREESERALVKEAIETCLSKNHAKVRIDVDGLYQSASVSGLEKAEQSVGSGVVFTPAMRRLIALLDRAFANGEPVLLIGETGCGKTTSCNVYADAVQKPIYTVNAHQNTEAGDILGSQRPVRNRAALEDALVGEVDYALAKMAITPGQESLDERIALMEKAGGVPSDIVDKRNRLNSLFEWVDGPLVQAMKEGGIFLLDEISLAEDAVLERLNSVLEPSKYLFLAEKADAVGGADGDSGLVKAVPGFQFVATMNPGGDYGKRELSPALRNRFTEIWVPSLTSEEDVLRLVEAGLEGGAVGMGSRMISFARWFSSQFFSTAQSARSDSSGFVSIRSLLTWKQFVNQHAGRLGLVPAVIHGAGMVYLDCLGANPSGLMGVAAEVSEQRKECIAKMDELFECDSRAVLDGHSGIVENGDRVAIGQFEFQKAAANTAQLEKFNFGSATTLSNTIRIGRALSLRRPILLEGSPGVGKTTLILNLARLLEKPITRMNLSEQTDLMDLFGSDVPSTTGIGRFEWRDAPFLTAMKRGDWVLLDEMNLASQSVLEGLNACLDHRGEVYISELGMTFKKHPDFAVFATQNPHHQGGGRKGLPSSFVDRFTVVYADKLEGEDLRSIAAHLFPDVPASTISSLIDFATKLDGLLQRRLLGAAGAPWEFNLRDVGRWIGLVSAVASHFPGVKLEHLLESVCLSRFRTAADRAAIRSHFRSTVGQAAARIVYTGLSSTGYQVGIATIPRHPITNNADRGASVRPVGQGLALFALEAVAVAVQHGWPVLLVGGPSSDKTAIVEQLARVSGARTVYLTLSSDTDAGDLVGGYEQVDWRREAAFVLSRTKKALRERVVERAKTGSSCTDELNLWRQVEEVDLDKGVEKDTLHALQAAGVLDAVDLAALTPPAEQPAAQFGWVDGLLVRALITGDWLVLEHANLCPSSVLDRLNSLLEPGGTLVVSEQAGDGEVRAVKPHPNFRIFMTVDPRFGELSRPMRNRTLEVCVDAELGLAGLVEQTEERDVSRMVQVPLYSQLSRYFDFFVALRSTAASDDLTEVSARIALSRLSLDDATLATKFVNQLSQGMLGLQSSQIEAIRTVFVDSLSVLSPTFYNWDDADERAVKRLSTVLGAQPLHPLANELRLVATTNKRKVCSRAALLERLFDVAAASRAASRPELRYLLSPAQLRQGGVIVQSASGLVHQTVPAILALLQEIDVDQDEIANVLAGVSRLLFFWETLANSCALPAGQTTAAVDGALVRLTGQLSRRVFTAAGRPAAAAAVPVLQLGSGTLLSELWQALHPSVPRTFARVELLAELERRVSDVDELIFNRINDAAAWPRLVELRAQLRRVLEACVRLDDSAVDLPGLFTVIDQCVASIQTDDEVEDGRSTPVFAGEFDMLCRLAGTPSASLELAALLALRPTKSVAAFEPEEPTGEALSRVLRASTLTSRPALVQDTLLRGAEVCRGVLTRLPGVSNLPLARLDTARGEVDALLTVALDSAPLFSIDENQMVAKLRELYADVKLVVDQVMAQAVVGDKEDAALKHSHISNVRSSYFDCVDNFLASEHQNGLSLARAWASFALGTIFLAVPDQPVDPAQEAVLAVAFAQSSRAAAGDRERMLRHWLAAVYDSRETLDVEKPAQLQSYESVQAEHTQSATVTVARPVTSRLAGVQAEFARLLIEVRKVDRIIGRNDATELEDASGQLAAASTNLGALSHRLVERHSGYMDLTGLVAGLVESLRLALQMYIAAAAKETRSERRAVIELSRTPALGDDASGVANEPAEEDSPVVLLQALRRAVFARSVGGSLKEGIENAGVVFATFYRAWKVNLQRERAEEAERGNWFQFANEADDPTAEDREFRAMFGESLDDENADEKDEDEKEKGMGEEIKMIKSDKTVLTLAELHQAIFDPPSASNAINSVVNGAVSLLQTPELSGAAVPSALLYGSAVRALTSAKEVISSTSDNFYFDPNPAEARQLLALANKFKAHFANISRTFPEQATPQLVLQCVAELAALPATFPLNKLISKAEELHKIVDEWEKISSRQYSAVILIGELTTLVIRWRQLELRAWDRLCDAEVKTCERRAAEWWWVIYENVIAMVEGVVEGGNEETADDSTQPTPVDAHLQTLIATLEQFMRTSSVGEFASRLKLLHQFTGHVAELVTAGGRAEPVFKRVQHALANIISFFTLFAPAIATTVMEEHSKVRKEIGTVIKLATWKDVNIDALRQSARQSHRKLFKLVRKFRAALCSSAAGLTSKFPDEKREKIDGKKAKGKISQSDKVTEKFLTPPSQVAPPEPAQTATILVESLGVSLPSRFQNASLTARLIRQMTTLPIVVSSRPDKTDDDDEIKDSKDHTAPSEGALLVDFLADLQNTVAVLQKETAAAASSADVKQQIANLKQQKRAVYADVLKTLREWGLSTNPSLPLLAAQNSNEAVLSTASALSIEAGLETSNPVFEASGVTLLDAPFFQLLTLMPQVRDSARSHAGDLAHSDVLRSVALLESLLAVSLRQRRSLASAVRDLVQLRAILKQLAALRTAFIAGDEIAYDSTFSAVSETRVAIRRAVPCIGLVVELTVGDSRASEWLGPWHRRLADLDAAAHKLALLPDSVVSKSHLDWAQMAKDAVADFHNSLTVELSRPGANPLLAQLASWVGTGHLNGRASLQSTDKASYATSFMAAADKVLAAVQAARPALSAFPAADEPGWLTVSVASLTKVAIALRVPVITASLAELVMLVPSDQLDAPGGLAAFLGPVLDGYEDAVVRVVERMAEMARGTVGLAVFLASTFLTLCREGYCEPKETDGEADGDAKVEGGTGLGDGGADEDISNEIADDEDLNGEGEKDEQKNEIEKEDNAIEAGDRDVEADFEDVSGDEKEEDGEGEEEEGEDDEMDEDIGEVDNDEFDEVDEKMWDEGAEAEKNQDGKDAKGQKTDEMAANEAEDEKDDAEEDAGEDEPAVGEDVAEVDGEDADEQTTAEQQEEKTLDLPENLDFDDGDDIDMDGDDIEEPEEDESENIEDAGETQMEDSNLDDPEEGKKDEADAEGVDNSDPEDDAADPMALDSDGELDDEDKPEDEPDTHLTEPDKDANANEPNKQEDTPDDAGLDADPEADPNNNDTADAAAAQAQSTDPAEAQPNAGEDAEAGPAENEDTSDTRQQVPRTADATAPPPPAEPEDGFSKLGDSLQQWFNRNISKAEETEGGQEEQEQPAMEERDLAEAEFEHVKDDADSHDAQAIGAADEKEAIDRSNQVDDPERPEGEKPVEDEPTEEPPANGQQAEMEVDQDDASDIDSDDLLDAAAPARQNGAEGDVEMADESDEVDQSESEAEAAEPAAAESEAVATAAGPSSSIAALTPLLTEQLRLILTPTLATKLRGDFRTGKRLNIKRIIPYIASDYKRDKIWMRRSVPSKRDYQILLAVDDSRSMAENGAGRTAVDAVALVGAALDRLDVGAVAVVRFGRDVTPVHPFGTPFTAAAAAAVHESFSFAQDSTDVRALVTAGTDLLRDARAQAAAASAELWQLMIVISDGHCQDHDKIRRQVRAAAEDRVMIVFVVVDPKAAPSPGASAAPTSVTQLRSASFEQNPSTGAMEVVWKNYFDTFPFNWYVLVNDVTDIPVVLAGALRQWFGEVVGS